jgi:hypothetical protein
MPVGARVGAAVVVCRCGSAASVDDLLEGVPSADLAVGELEAVTSFSRVAADRF